MCPYVDTLVMYHEETSKYFTWGIESDSVAMCDMMIIFHVGWCIIIVSNKMIDIICWF
jgi:hypothetical protein